MRLVLWHGYLLADTGSNIYTQHIARAWGRLGHSVTLFCQDPDPGRYDLGPNVRVVRPDIGGVVPVFVLDRYPDLEARHVGDLSADELALYVRRNADAIRAELGQEPADLALANHAVMGGPVAAAACAGTETPFAVKVHGSELEYAIRGRPLLAAMAREALDEAVAVFAGSTHTEEVTADLLGDGAYLARIRIVPPGVDVDGFRPENGSRHELLRLLREAQHVPGDERSPDAGAAERLAGVGRFILYFGKLMRQKGVHVLLDAWDGIAARHPEMSLVVVGFGADREELERRAGERVVFTGAMGHGELQRLVPLADAVVVPSVLPEAFGMVAAEAAACAVVPIVAAHSGLAEVADGLGEAGLRFDGSAAQLAERIDWLLRLPVSERRRLGRVARRATIERWSWKTVAEQLLEPVRAPASAAVGAAVDEGARPGARRCG
jgi:glycosyltransferase involved in cell wall biosynthesis